jgi:uncharacterized protein (TIGR02145 family)
LKGVRIFGLLVVLLFGGFSGVAQLAITPGSTINLTVQQFVQTYLVGTGVTVSNATFNGQTGMMNGMGSIPCNGSPFLIADQIGVFTAAGTAFSELELASGIILSSGKVQDADRLNLPFGDASLSTCSGTDDDLTILGGNTSQDKAVLEFDFVPETDVISFRYVFASEEFDNFCNGNYNDAFGFFLSAIDISGGQGFSNDAVNIALLPSTPPSPVTIHNICQTDFHLLVGTYSWWNGTQDVPPENWSTANGVIFTYNRFTNVLTAYYQVTCGIVHHIKIAIADLFDQQFDSGIFLEANSFSSNSIVPNTTFTNPETDNLMIAGCSNASLTYSIAQARTTDLSISLVVDPSGTAGQSDILPNPFPATTIIPAGSIQSSPIIIQALPAAPGPDKTLVIKASTTACNNVYNYFSNYTIRYNAPLAAALGPQAICSGASVTLSPMVSGGQMFLPSNVYHYLWNTGATTPSITVSPGMGSHTYSMTVTDACGASAVATTIVNVGIVPPTPGAVSGENIICVPATGKVYTVDPLSGADAYIWTIPTGASIVGANDGNSIVVDFDATVTAGSITVKGHNNICGDGPESSLALTISPPLLVTIQPQPPICIDAAPVSLQATPSGGIFSGAGVTGNTFSPVAAGAGTHEINYTYTDANGCSGSDAKNIIVNPLPVVSLSDLPDVCIGTPAITLTGGSPAGGVYSGTGVAAGMFNPGTAGIGIHPITYTYTDLQGCTGSDQKSIQVAGLPNVGFTGTVAPDGVCQEYPTPYRYEVPADPLATYIWTLPAPYTAQGIVTPVTGQPHMADVVWTGTGAAQLKLEAISTLGCQNSKVNDIIINPKPQVSLTACFDQVTTTNAKSFLLKGGTPTGSEGKYYINGTLATGSLLNPAALAPGDYTIAYTYTNIHGCPATDSKPLTVGASNAGYSCTGNFFTDPRNSDPATNRYPTTSVTANGRTTCWMLKNLNWGDVQPDHQPQTDNCITEKYCAPGDNTCTTYGAFYHWDELMQYNSTPGWPKGVCPPGWHVPTAVEWQDLIDAFSGNGQAGSDLKDLNTTLGFHGMLEGVFYLNIRWAFSAGTVSPGTMFWTSTLSGSKPIVRGLNYFNPSVSLYESSPANAFPVRCVKDN